MAEVIDVLESPEEEECHSDIEEDPDTPFPYTDLGLEVEGKILYVAKSILKNKSPVFKKMLESDFQEKDKEVIKLPGKKVEDMTLFLKCLCPFIGHPITVDNVMQILPLESEYCTEEIKQKCENVICGLCGGCSTSLGSGERDGTKINIKKILYYLISYELYNLNEKVYCLPLMSLHM